MSDICGRNEGCYHLPGSVLEIELALVGVVVLAPGCLVLTKNMEQLRDLASASKSGASRWCLIGAKDQQ